MNRLHKNEEVVSRKLYHFVWWLPLPTHAPTTVVTGKPLSGHNF